MARTLEQFIKFGTSAYGLERTFRLLQSLTLILVHIPAIPVLLFHLLSRTGTVPPPGPTALDVSTLTTLSGLTSRLNLGRRFFRVFRFLDAFNSAYLLSTSGTGGLSLDAWLTVSAHSFNGMYFLLETLTFPDVLGVPGVSIWGAEWGKVLRVESQRFWLFALVCGAAAGAIKVKGGAVEGRKRYRTLRKTIANVLDVPLPGVVVGWVPVSEGAVGVCMLLSTWLTAAEVWEACGEQVDEERLKMGKGGGKGTARTASPGSGRASPGSGRGGSCGIPVATRLVLKETQLAEKKA